ncbi:MAG: potassium channel family protein [Solirubrobacterales bacterium]
MGKAPRKSPLDSPGKLAEALHLTAPRHSFGVVFAAIVVTVIYQLSVPDTELTRLIGVILQGFVALVALRAAGAHVKMLRASAVVVVLLIVAAALGAAFPTDATRIAVRMITLFLIMLTPIAVLAGVVRELREDKRVTVQTVYCGLCIYMLLGTGFAVMFGVLDDIGGSTFFAGGVEGTPSDFLYFSLATLTTTGYGDFTAGTEVGRAMSVTEALIGQMYLVTVLAVIVSNVRRQRPFES